MTPTFPMRKHFSSPWKSHETKDSQTRRRWIFTSISNELKSFAQRTRNEWSKRETRSRCFKMKSRELQLNRTTFESKFHAKCFSTQPAYVLCAWHICTDTHTHIHTLIKFMFGSPTSWPLAGAIFYYSFPLLQSRKSCVWFLYFDSWSWCIGASKTLQWPQQSALCLQQFYFVYSYFPCCLFSNWCTEFTSKNTRS